MPAGWRSRSPAGPAVLALLLGGCAALEVPHAVPDDGAEPFGERRTVLREPVFGDDLHVLEAGPPGGRPVVLVHGLGDAAARDWQTVLPALAEAHHVLALDLPGFGRSGKSNELYSPANYSRVLDWLIRDRFGDRPVTLVGHSMGGAIALRFASDRPEALDRLVLANVAGVLHRATFLKYVTRLSSDRPWLDRIAEGVNRWTRRLVHWMERFPTDLEGVLGDATRRQRLLDGEPGRIAAAALITEDFSGRLESVRSPTVVLWGDRDPIAPLRTGQLLVGELPRSSLRVIPETGHTPMIERPEAFRRALLDAIHGTPPAPPTEDDPRPGLQDLTLEGAVEQEISGSFRHVRILACDRVRLRDLVAASVEISASRVEMIDTTVIATEVAVRVKNSTVQGTSLRLEGDVAIQADLSQLDLAGARLVGRSAAATTDTRASIVFSVSRIEGPSGASTVHAVRHLSKGRPLG